MQAQSCESKSVVAGVNPNENDRSQIWNLFPREHETWYKPPT